MMTTKRGFNPQRWLFGVPCTIIGIFIILMALSGQFESMDAEQDSPIVGLLFGLGFLLPGLLGLQLERLITLPGDPRIREMIFGGLIFTTAGIALIIISVVDDNDAAFHAPRWTVTSAGFVFALCGIWLTKTALSNRGMHDEKSVFNQLLFAVVLSCFGAVVTWVSLGAGERSFSGSVSLPLVSISGGANELLGRICFLPGALVLDVGAVGMWFYLFRRLVRATQQEGWQGKSAIGILIFVLGAAIGVVLLIISQRTQPQ
jgi:hypothetical protein